MVSTFGYSSEVLTVSNMTFKVCILWEGVSNFEEVLCNMSLSRRDTASGRCERSEESPDKLRHNAQFVGDSSLPAVVQNDMIILVLDTCNAGNRLWIRTSQRNATCS